MTAGLSDGEPAIDGYRQGGRAAASFEDLVTAATVGVSRRPFAVTDLDGPAAAHAEVLDAS